MVYILKSCLTSDDTPETLATGGRLPQSWPLMVYFLKSCLTSDDTPEILATGGRRPQILAADGVYSQILPDFRWHT